MYLINRYALAVMVCLTLKVKAEVVPVYQIEQSQNPYLQTALTHDIYRYSASVNLADLVVLDSNGNQLPYGIKPQPNIINKNVDQHSARFFPIFVGASPETLLALSSASIKLDDNEISVSVEKKYDKTLGDFSGSVDFYLIDLSDSRLSVENLVLQWQTDIRDLYLEIEVSGSNDLNSWRPLANTTLVHLEKNGQALIRNKIMLNLEATEYAYLKVKFLGKNEQVALTHVYLENSSQILDTKNLDQWSLSGTLSDYQETILDSGKKNAIPVAAWEYQRDDIAPVSKIGLQLKEFVYGDNVQIYSRANSKQPWKLVHQGIWFNVQVGNEWQQSDAVNINPNSDVFWRVELHQSAGTTMNPMLMFYRNLEILQIIANSAGPFKVGIDIDAQSDPQSKELIFKQLTSGKDIDWKSLTLTNLNPDITQFSRHGMTVSWKTMLFWLILFLSISVLFTLPIRLMRQMKEKSA